MSPNGLTHGKLPPLRTSRADWKNGAPPSLLQMPAFFVIMFFVCFNMVGGCDKERKNAKKKEKTKQSKAKQSKELKERNKRNKKEKQRRDIGNVTIPARQMVVKCVPNPCVHGGLNPRGQVEHSRVGEPLSTLPACAQKGKFGFSGQIKCNHHLQVAMFRCRM